MMSTKSLSTLALACGLAACSAPEPYDQVHHGELTDDDPRVSVDQSPYDHYEFEADEGWLITAEMRSDAFDTYLWLISGGTALVQVDDGFEDGSTNSRISHTTQSRGTYIVRANSYTGAGRGPYTLHITARPAGTPAPAPAPTKRTRG